MADEITYTHKKFGKKEKHQNVAKSSDESQQGDGERDTEPQPGQADNPTPEINSVTITTEQTNVSSEPEIIDSEPKEETIIYVNPKHPSQGGSKENKLQSWTIPQIKVMRVIITPPESEKGDTTSSQEEEASGDEGYIGSRRRRSYSVCEQREDLTETRADAIGDVSRQLSSTETESLLNKLKLSPNKGYQSMSDCESKKDGEGETRSQSLPRTLHHSHEIATLCPLNTRSLPEFNELTSPPSTGPSNKLTSNISNLDKLSLESEFEERLKLSSVGNEEVEQDSETGELETVVRRGASRTQHQICEEERIAKSSEED